MAPPLLLLWLALAAAAAASRNVATAGEPSAEFGRNRNQSKTSGERASEDARLTDDYATHSHPQLDLVPDGNQLHTKPTPNQTQSDQPHGQQQQQQRPHQHNRAHQQHEQQQQIAPDDQNDLPPLFYETPETRRQLTTYILGEFHQFDMNSVLDKSQLELSRKDVFGQVIAEPLDEAHASLRSNESVLGDTPTAYSANASLSRPYFGEVFESFQTLYWPIHCVIGLVICSVGIIANLINVIVLTRPNMISAVNTILCAIACSDLIVNVSNIPYLMHELADSSNLASYYSYNWAHYILVHAHLTVTLHTISIWLTCALATLRYCVLRSTYSSSQTYSVGTALRVIFGVVVLVPVFCIPNYLSFDIVSERTKNQITIYKVGFSSLAEDTQFIKTFHFWIFSCLTKLLPCLLLTYFTSVLIKLLARARERRMRLSNLAEGSTPLVDPRSTPTAIPNGHKWNRRKASDNQQQIGLARSAQKHRTSDAADNELNTNKLVANGLKLGRGVSGPSRDLSSQQQRNVLVIEETSAAASPRTLGHGAKFGLKQQQQQQQQHDDEAQNEEKLNFDGAPKLKRDNSRGPTNSQGRLAHAGSLREMANMTKATSDIDVEPTIANIDNMVDRSENDDKNLSCQLAAHSGSSCATDAECLQVTGSVSSNGSSSNTIDQAVQQKQRSHLTPPQQYNHSHSHNHQNQYHQQQQPLLVETMLSGVQTTSSTTTTTRTFTMNNNNNSDDNGILNDGTKLDGGDGARQHDANVLDNCQGSLSQRSASIGGALELYAIKNEVGSGTESRLTKTGQTKHNQRNSKQTSTDDRSGVALNDSEKCSKRGLGSNRSGSALIQSSANDDHNPEGLTATMLDQTNRPRSIGSGSFAPLQIVRFQATHRQLSQNETTTRLLIAVIIVFLICEFPAGILAALCAVLGQDFFDNVYQPMGTFTDLLALINSSVNFMIYCFMSTQFRVTFYRVVLHCPAPREINTNNR